MGHVCLTCKAYVWPKQKSSVLEVQPTEQTTIKLKQS